MGKALPLALREDIIRLYESGTSLVEISSHLGVCYSTIRLICKRFRVHGVSGLATDYKNCGSRGSRIEQDVLDACIHLRSSREWGARRILVELKSIFPDRKLPSERSITQLLQRKKNDQTA